MSRRPVAIALLTLTLIGGDAIPAEEPAADEAFRSIVPITGNLTGWGNVQWRGGLRIANPSSREIFVGVTLLEAGYPAIAFSVAPGDSVAFQDVAAEAFDVRGRAVALEIASAGAAASVESTVIGTRPDGGTSRPFAIPVMTARARSGVSTLSGLAFNAGRRTTLGIGNLGEQEVTITIALERLEGRSLATATVKVPPLTLYHAPIRAWFPLLDEADDLTVVIDSPSPLVYSYACVIENESHEATFISPSHSR